MDNDNAFFFFFNDTATTEIYTLSLHDALPICRGRDHHGARGAQALLQLTVHGHRSEEHTSELQSRLHLVCRLLLEKKKLDQSAHYSGHVPRFDNSVYSERHPRLDIPHHKALRY